MTALFQITFTYFGIKEFGLIGTIYAALLSKIIQVILTIVMTRGIFKYEFNYFKIIGIPFVYIAVNIIQYHLVPDYNLFYYLCQLILFGLIFYFVFKNEIRIVLQQYLKAK